MAFLLGSVGVLACSGQDATAGRTSFAAVVEVVSDPGVPVAGALVEVAGSGSPERDGARTDVRTDANGRASLTLFGRQGDTALVRVTCPEGFAGPREPLAVKLRAFAPGLPTPAYTVPCSPNHRTVVVAVRAPGAAFVPVLRLGKRIAVTNADGIAHAVLDATPGEPLSLTLDTDGAKGVVLEPSRPSVTRPVPDRDDYLLFDFRVNVVPPKRQVFQRARPMRI